MKNTINSLNREKTSLNRILLFSALLIGPLLLWNSCANIVAPTGGLKDQTPPKVKNSIPKNGSLNFTGNKIELNFNEFIKLKNPEKEILISPNLKYEPEYKYSKKKVEIKFKDTLQQNTTYTINFGGSITDVNEGNVDSTFSFAFSTGPIIDTNKISGNLINTLSGKPESNFYVFLLEDSLPKFSKKYTISYYSKSNAGGQFQIKNVKNGSFYLFVLKDENFNKNYDIGFESIAFMKNKIEVNKDTFVSNLMTFIANIGNDIKYNSEKNSFTSSYTNLINTTISAQDTPANIVVTRHSDSLKVEYLDPKTDTVFLKFTNPLAKIDTTFKILPIKLKIKSAQLSFSQTTFNMDEPIQLKYSNPIKSLDTSKIILLEDSIKKIPFIAKINPNNPYLISISSKFEEDKKYYLQIEKSGFIDAFEKEGISFNGLIPLTFSKDLSKIKLKIINKKNQNLLVEILSDKQKIEHHFSINQTKNIEIPYLKPGIYKIRIIVDQNQNGKWDTGNLDELEQPEQIIYYEKILSIKANWEQEIIWEPNL